MSMANRMKDRPVLVNARSWPVDPVIAVTFTALVFVGLIMVASASLDVSARAFGNPFAMFLRHGVYLCAALFAGAAALSVPIKAWQNADWLLLGLSFCLLIAVLVPGIGREVNGSTRWIPLGIFNLQGSEFVKLFVAVYLSGYLVRHREDIRLRFAGFALPLGVIGLLAVLLLAQPDFGAAAVILAATLGVIFLAGAPFRFFLPIVLGVVVLGGALIILEPYRLARLASLANPWQHQFEGGYQLTQALIAIGRGEWFGLGLGNSIQKLFFLPEAHTDFLFSIVVEELGVAGAVLLIGLFACLSTRALWIGRAAENRGLYFHAYLAFSIALLLGLQAAINIGVNVGVLPTKGITLPLMSYGGNSLIVSCMMIGILLRIEYECHREVSGKPLTRRKEGRRNGR